MPVKPIRVLIALSVISLGACGGSGDADPPLPPAPSQLPSAAHAIGGSLSGLAGGTVVLQLNGAGDLALSANGTFTFASMQSSGFTYTVTVSMQPAGQNCVVANGSGTVASANVTGIAVSCEAASAPSPQPSFNRRVRTMRYDFDNNGVFEGTESYTYDSAGKVIASTYSYVADGTPDADLVSFDLRSSLSAGGNETGAFTYDAQGRLERWTMHSAAARSELNFRWRGNGTLDTATFDGFDASGALTSRLNFATTYTDGRLASWQFTTPDAPMFTQSLTLAYDAGVLQSDLLTTRPGDSRERREFVWTNGRLERIRTFNPDAPALPTSTTQFVFSEGRHVRRLHAETRHSYSWNYAYDASGLLRTKSVDLNDDGSIEALVAIEWEEGSCQLVTTWAPRAEADPALPVDPERTYALGDGHGPLPLCGNVP